MSVYAFTVFDELKKQFWRREGIIFPSVATTTTTSTPAFCFSFSCFPGVLSQLPESMTFPLGGMGGRNSHYSSSLVHLKQKIIPSRSGWWGKMLRACASSLSSSLGSGGVEVVEEERVVANTLSAHPSKKKSYFQKRKGKKWGFPDAAGGEERGCFRGWAGEGGFHWTTKSVREAEYLAGAGEGKMT